MRTLILLRRPEADAPLGQLDTLLKLTKRDWSNSNAWRPTARAAVGGFLPFVMKLTPPSPRGIGRKLLSIGINLPVSKFLNVPKPTLATSAVPACGWT